MNLGRFGNRENGEMRIGAGSNAIGIRCLPVCLNQTVSAGMENSRVSMTIILHTYQNKRIYWGFFKSLKNVSSYQQGKFLSRTIL